MKFTLLIESDSLLEAKHKCIVDATNFVELKTALIKDLDISIPENELLMELFDSDFEVPIEEETAMTITQKALMRLILFSRSLLSLIRLS